MSNNNLFSQSGSKRIDSLVTKINSYGNRNASSNLFTIFDKTVYVNNENVWFTSYLLNHLNRKHEATILTTILVNDQFGSIASEQKFAIADGLSFGHTIIPDSIAPGNYTFITYTNVLTNGRPRDVFVQPISIKTAAQADFLVSLNLMDSTRTVNDSEQISLAVETKIHMPIKGAIATWTIGALNDNIASGKIRTDADGRYLFTISPDQIKAGKNFLNVSVNYKNEVRNVALLLPVKDDYLNIAFYPEGGNLVDGLASTVGWEAKTVYGRPLKINGVLYQDNRAIDTIHSDSYGMGWFRFLPKSGCKYEIKLIGYHKKINYTFPNILSKGALIHVHNAIADDSLQLILASKDPERLYVMIHNLSHVFYSVPVYVTPTGRKIVINLADLPKGLSTITILDSLLRPCAERMFFAHYNRRSRLNISTDRQEYSTREKVRVKLSLPFAKKDSEKGVVTVSCVQNSRIEVKKFNDIESYHYLKQELDILPVRETYMGQSAQDKEYLEKVLLIKGWRKYKWQNLAQDNAQESTGDEKRLLISGEVTRYGKPLKKPVNIVVMTDSALNAIVTDAKGNFQLNNNNAITGEGRKVHLMLSGPADGAYKIKMNDSFNMINHTLINGFKAVNYNLTPVPIISSDSSAMKGLDHAISLKEVKITGKKENGYTLQQLSRKQKNECGDYVCYANFLNCLQDANDSRNREPVVGETYHTSRGNVVYKGCTIITNGTAATAVNGISYPKEFYGSDYSQFSPSEPEYQSTIYWKHACFVDSKEIELEFYTSDITGPFSIVVQGVSSKDLIYERKEFSVKKKQ
jgi:hypothetical protein